MAQALLSLPVAFDTRNRVQSGGSMPCSTSNDGHQGALLKQWETLLDAVPAMVFFKDPQNRFLQVNRAYAEAIGLPKEEIIGRAVSDFLADARRVEAYWQDDREVIESGRPKRNITAPHITDSRRWLRTEKLPVRDRDNRIIGVVGLSVDISDLKRTERQLDLRIRQQEAIAAIGQSALSGIESGRLFEEAAALVCRTLEVDCCQVLKSPGDGNRCIPLAQAGGEQDPPGAAPCKDGENARSLCPLRLKRPLVIRNLQARQRLCRAFPGLVERGVTSSLLVTIGPKNKPFGVLASHSIPPRRFCRADRDFVRGAAHMLALA
ncbi:MAG: PAS domain S-box protein, partial [Opitutae bacterium]|nr:PAS domain S-box protein [Opitutae bacterium]